MDEAFVLQIFFIHASQLMISVPGMDVVRIS